MGIDIKHEDNEIQVISAGIEYLLDTSDRANKAVHHILFCHKNENGKFIHGVTTEVVLKMLIDRQRKLMSKDDCTENTQALLFLQQALQAIKRRNFAKMKRRDEYKGNGLPVSAGRKSD